MKYEELIHGFYINAIRRVSALLSIACMDVLRRFWDDAHLLSSPEELYPHMAIAMDRSVSQVCMRNMNSGDGVAGFASEACEEFVKCVGS